MAKRIRRTVVLAFVLLAATVEVAAGTCVPQFPYSTAIPIDAFGVFAYDFNGDGLPDLFFPFPSGSHWGLALNSGHGAFEAPIDVVLGGDGYSQVGVGDLDGDGVLDLVAVDTHSVMGSVSIDVYKGVVASGKGFSFRKVSSRAGPGYASPPVLADFDGDGNLDLALSEGASTVALYPGDGRGGFGAPREQVFSSVGILGSLSVERAVDLNGDHRADLVVRTYSYFPSGGSSALTTLMAGPDFTFVEQPGWPQVVSKGGFAFALGDVDGDGRTDIVVSALSGSGGGNIETFLQKGDGTFAHTTQASIGLYPIALADLDGDGHLDLVGISAGVSFGAVTFRLGDGRGSFGPPSTFALPGPAMYLSAADFTGAGHTDLLVSGFQSGPPLLFLNGCGPGFQRTLVVPILLSSPGVGGTFWRSDLTLTNTGTTPATADLTYTATDGGGSGTVTASLPPQTRLSGSSAFDLLVSLGLTLPAAERRTGTLRADFHGLASPHAAAISVRTSSDGAGVAYGGVDPPGAGAQLVFGLREDGLDRSNLGLMHAGPPSSAPVTLSIEITSTDRAMPGSVVLPGITLQPGEFRQFDRVLALSGLGASSGWARIAAVAPPSGVPFVAWGVINDETGTSDGTFLPGRNEFAPPVATLPSIVETPAYETEVVLTNASATACIATLTYHSSGLQDPHGAVFLDVPVPAGGEVRLSGIVDVLRRANPGRVGDHGLSFTGILETGSCSGIHPTARVLGTLRRFGVGIAPPASASWAIGTPSPRSAVVPDLRQDSSLRTNLAVANLAFSQATYRVELYGSDGRPVASRDVQTSPAGWLQIDGILSTWAPGTTSGWARILEVAGGSGAFLAYGVVNDGAAPGLGTGDGSVVWMEPEP